MFNLKKVFAGRSHDTSSSGVEGDQPQSLTLFVLVAVLSISLVVIVIGIRELVWMTADQINEQDNISLDQKTREEKEAIKADLQKYDVVDQQKGIYQIPIDRAMEILVQRQSLEPVSKGK